MSRYVLAAVLAATLIVAPQASSSREVGPPANLHAFLLRANEPVKADHTYAEMPAFVWNAVQHASRYSVQLADNASFSDVSILYQDTSLTVPVASIQLQVPWMTGDPYALWIRVRAMANGRWTGWSKSFGFNTGWQNTPQQESAPTGLIRWTPVEGATGYEVWFTNINRVISTLTNVADEREYWTLHPGLGSTIQWRVRAVRSLSSSSLPNSLAITPYGPWSDPYTTLTSGSITPGPLKGGTTISDVASPGPHALMPAFAWSGTDGKDPTSVGQQLWRVYVFSDKRCVNQVMVGSITGSPAWAPRATQSLALPATVLDVTDTENKGTILKYGSEGATFMADLTPVIASEDVTAAASTSTGTATSTNGTTSSTITPGQIELPDSGWPTGRYWWTVVPVAIYDVYGATGVSDPSDAVEYHDTELPQDACATGRVWPFSIRSAPVTTATADKPYISGLALGQRVVAAATRVPKFLELPIVTWKPAIGAQSYEIQLSHRLYPWSVVKTATTVVTSTVLPLTKSDHGTWYYRVRGVNPYLPANAQMMTWSAAVEIRITGNQVLVVR